MVATFATEVKWWTNQKWRSESFVLTGILNCTVITQVDISMFITFANWPLNVCELTSTRLRTDQRRLWNDRWRNDRLPFWPVPQDSQLKILKIAQNILYIYIYIYIYNIFLAIWRILSWLSIYIYIYILLLLLIARKLTFEYGQMRVTSKIPKNYKQKQQENYLHHIKTKNTS